MKIINQGIVIESKELDYSKLATLEKAARICYKSEGNFKGKVNEKFLRGLVKSGHESVLEHEKITVKIITDRAITHEIVRHRLASYSQESTRYCNYGADKFENEVTFIKPCFDPQSSLYANWLIAMDDSEKHYFHLLNEGAKPEEARAVLPNSLKAEIYVTMNFRAWRHFIKLRIERAAHPQIRELAAALLDVFVKAFPPLFDDIVKSPDFTHLVDVAILGED